IAAVSSTLASALMPVGLARRIEPHPGIRFDPGVTLVGALAVAVGVAVVALAAAIVVTRPAHARRAAWNGLRPWRGPRVTPVVDVGARLGFDRRSPALPVRSSLLGVAAALLGLVGALTFSASLDRFVATPSRWGFAWDVNAPGNLETALNAHSLARQPAVDD